MSKEFSGDLFKGYGVEIDLKKDSDYHIIQETLSRIGYASKKDKTLYQSCHIFHRQGKYAIMHFKEMLAFDGKQTEISENDLERRDMITKLLKDWNLIEDHEPLDSELHDMSNIYVVRHSDKENWNFVKKYTFSKRA